jgi:hypothetical protein
MLRKILCFIGWHTWTWRLGVDEILRLDDPIPIKAVCCHCGESYEEEA